MTSIAAYLAALTGAAPQEGQTATLANATGGVGLFAALLASSESAQAVNGETTLPPGTYGLPVPAPTGRVATDASGDGAVLREALTDGLELPQDGADIDAIIIEAPLTEEIEAPPANGTAQSGSIQPVSGKEIESPIPRDAQPAAQSVTTEVSAESPLAAILLDETAPPITPIEASPRQQNQTPANPSARPTVLENPFDRAPKAGKDNGLQLALSQTAQARGAGETRQPGVAQGENIPDAQRGNAPGATDQKPAINPAATQPELAQKAPEIIQRLIKTGNGQPVIQILERPGGETPGASSPPTLTVSVQAPAASPGPASANAPHVPVSALAVTIARQASNGAKRFDIRLDPPELGRIEVRLNVSRDGQVMTHLVVERAETLDLLQRDARQLERALQNAGLDTSEGGMKFSLKDQGLAHGGADGFDSDDDMNAQAEVEGDEDRALIAGDAMPPPTRYLATTSLDIRI